MLVRVLCVLFGVLVALAVVEVALRLSGRIPEVANPLYSFHLSDPVVGWLGKPDIRMRFRRPDFDVLVANDANGWRIPDPARPLDATRRILVLGDSFTWGWGVGQGEVFTDHLQRALPDAAVINHGVNAYSTSQEYILLQQELARQRYDVVILMFFFNDVADNVASRSGRRPLFTVANGQLVPPRAPARPFGGVVHLWLKDHSLAYRLIDYVAGVLKHGVGELPEPREAPANAPDIAYSELRGAAVTEHLIRAMAEACKAHDAGFIVVYIPQRSEVGAKRPLPAARAVHALARDAAATAGAPFLDLTAAFAEAIRGGDVVYFPHDAHWTPAGHALAARTLLATGLLSGARQPRPRIFDPGGRRTQQGGRGAERVVGRQDGADDGDTVGSHPAHGAGALGVDTADPKQRQ